jgi:hypothetical protein
MTSKPGIKTSITNPRFQENASLSQPLRAALGEDPKRVFYEVDPVTKEIINETVELRSERPQIKTETKGGGGRKRAESVSPPDNPLDTLIVQKQVMPTGAQTRPVQESIQPEKLVQTGGLELSPPVYANTDQTGRIIDSYGIQTGNYPKADITMRPTEMPISPRTGKPTQSWSTRPTSSPEVAKEGMRVSEDLRAIYNSGRPDAQQQADAYIQALRKRMGN